MSVGGGVTDPGDLDRRTHREPDAHELEHDVDPPDHADAYDVLDDDVFVVLTASGRQVYLTREAAEFARLAEERRARRAALFARLVDEELDRRNRNDEGMA